jgi:predicted RNA-binding protein with PIN domain
VSWVIDGNNVLGRIGTPRPDSDTKRALVRMLAAFARAERTKVICAFDGDEPEHFGTHLGAVSVVFSGSRTADELIAKRVATGRGWHVVTADRVLANRIARREVTIVDPLRFVKELEALPREEEERGAAEDWMAWFSDPKNRADF